RSPLLTLFSLLLIFSFRNNAQSPSPPGVIEGLSNIVQATREQLTKEYQELINTGKLQESPTQELIEKSKISDVFLRSLFLHSEKKYLEMINISECHLYALIENQLLKSALGTIDLILMESNGEKFLVSSKNFVEQVYKFKCQGFSQFSKIFDDKNLKKTVLSLSYPVPKTQDECDTIIEDWKKNDSLPYLCKVPNVIYRGKSAQAQKAKTNNADLRKIRTLNQAISRAETYLSDIPFFQRNYLKTLCDAMESKEKFCRPYLAQDAWSKILNGEIDVNYLRFKCTNLYGKPADAQLTQVQLATCAKRMKEEPSLCTTKSADGFPSIFPRPNCQLISEAINHTRLKTYYHDCPGQIDNGAVVNIHRVLAHYKDLKIESRPESCQAESTFSLLTLNKDAKNPDGWPLKVCYDDRIEGKEICNEYIPGSLKKTTISEEKVVTKILNRTAGLPNSAKCKMIEEGKYNPALLEYKNGCFIVFDDKNCSNSYCPKKVYIDEKEFKGLKFIGNTAFDYVPNSWKDQKKSGLTMMEEAYKLRSKKLRNLTELEVFLRQKEDRIVQGVGCSEDLLPRFFKRNVFNQCTPLPFIIDGVVRQNDNMLLVLRTSLDDIHSPRLIPWNWVFTGVMKYQAHQPLNQWTLYGIN
ncbi:unnamed protein product, partial [Chrysoparadoxa australica]